MAALKLKRGRRARVLQGHCWVYASEVSGALGREFDGEVVECRDGGGRFIGSGIYNSRSQIVWRKVSEERVKLDRAFFRKRLGDAVARRRGEERVQRLVWSESDGLPGLVVDRFEGCLVAQMLTLAMDRRKEMICEILNELLTPSAIVLRNDSAVREREGLKREVEVFKGEMPEPFWVDIGGVEFWVDVTEGQKTGFYLDQRFEYSKVAGMARGRRVLDAFCNQGGFALHCARSGAGDVVAVDSSDVALKAGRRNAERNEVSVSFKEANVFDYLREGREREWDLIVLDPPSFAKSKDRLGEALRGYKELNLRAFQRLRPGGILATYSCSFHVSHDVFSGVVASAAGDAGREARVLEYRRQSYDHPVLLTMPESEYLRGMLVEVA